MNKRKCEESGHRVKNRMESVAAFQNRQAIRDFR